MSFSLHIWGVSLWRWSIVAGVMLAYFVALPVVPSIAFLLPATSAPFRLLWYILIAWRLFQLGRGAPEGHQ